MPWNGRDTEMMSSEQKANHAHGSDSRSWYSSIVFRYIEEDMSSACRGGGRVIFCSALFL